MVKRSEEFGHTSMLYDEIRIFLLPPLCKLYILQDLFLQKLHTTSSGWPYKW